MKRRAYQARTLSGAHSEVRRLRSMLAERNGQLNLALQQRNDAALVASALAIGVARWETWGGARGELCVGGMKYSICINEFGHPDVCSENLKKDLKAAIAKARKA